MPSLGDLLGSFTGHTQEKAARNAGISTRAGIDAAYAGGRPLIEGGYSSARDLLGTGYTAGAATQLGALGESRGAIGTAADTGRSDITGGYSSALASLLGGSTGAQTGLTDARTRVTGYLQPYMTAGADAQGLYSRYLGTGPGGAADALSLGQNYAANDPGMAAQLEQIRRQSAAAANAGGYLGSGREAMARDRAVAERTSQEYQTYLTRLANQSALGNQAATSAGGFDTTLSGLGAQLQQRAGETAAGLHAQQGRDLSGLEQWRGGNLASLVTGYGNQRAQADQNYYGNMANLATGEGNSLAQLLMSKETGNAASWANQSLAEGKAAADGMNNIVDGIKAAASMYMGMPPAKKTSTGADTVSSWSSGTTTNPNYGYF